MPRSSTLRRLGAAAGLVRQHTQSLRIQQCAWADEQSFLLEGSFLVGEASPPPVHPFAKAFQATVGGSMAPRGDEIDAWLHGAAAASKILCDLSRWVRGSAMMVLPDDTLWDISHAVWNMFCSSLLFPQMCTAFEVFLLDPAASPEVVRFRLAGIGPVGPPIPPDHARPWVVPWEADLYSLTHDDVLDLESTAVTAVCLLRSIASLVVDAPHSHISWVRSERCPVMLGSCLQPPCASPRLRLSLRLCAPTPLHCARRLDCHLPLHQLRL